jgi:hypothetical protein
LQMKAGIGASAVAIQMEKDAQRRHLELLALLETRSDEGSTEYSASVRFYSQRVILSLIHFSDPQPFSLGQQVWTR